MLAEPGLYPTEHLAALLSQSAAEPGERLSIEIDGTDIESFIRGKELWIDQERAKEWQYVGTVTAAQFRDAPSFWLPAAATPLPVTLEGHQATKPQYFDVPPLDPGNYRLRVDLLYGNSGTADQTIDLARPLRLQTATLYSELQVLRASR